jgi:hypothetical protein
MSKRKHNLNFLLNSCNIPPLAKRRKPSAPPPVAASNPVSGPSTSAPLQQPAQTSTQAAYNQFKPPPPPSAFQTGQSVMKQILAAISDSADMFLPLKAALCGIVNIMDVMEVRRTAIASVRLPIWLKQRVGDVQDDFAEMALKIQALQTIFTQYQPHSQTNLALPIRQRFHALAR